MLSRRNLLCATAMAPLLTACATDLGRFGDVPLAALAAQRGVPAASYVVLKAGRAGAQERVSCCPVPDELGADSVFQAASLTKPVVAFATLQLSKGGQLDLNAPVSRYLPGGYAHRQNPFARSAAPRFDHVPPATLSRIPVACLLNHSSGLPNWTDGPLSPAFEPGQRWGYSGEGYVLLQAVLSAVAGQSFDALMDSLVFGPLHMRDSRMRMTNDIRNRVVDGHSWLSGKVRFDMLEANAAASLHTTAADYARLMAALVSDESLLSLSLTNRVLVDAGLGLFWGSGWGIEQADGGPYLWQWGNNPGFRAFAMVSTTSGDGFVMLTNSEKGMALAAPLARMAVPADHGVFRFPMLG